MTTTDIDDEMLSLFDHPGEPGAFAGLADDEIIIDCFAGGGGASLGIQWATGRSPDEAINHKLTALAIHEANHPATRHHHSDIWEVDPLDVARGRRVGLLWLSPDCTHFSKAKGGRPVSKKIRILAHVAVRYAKAVRPRIIMLENVEEFLGWGPVARATGKPNPTRKGQSFRTFVRQLRRLGYVVDWRLLRGRDYGAPTSRRRLFLVARCDNAPIAWPPRTHGEGTGTPWRTAAECIDFTLPCPSIFLSPAEAKSIGVRRPLVPNTMRRIARGIERFVISTANPFIVSYYSAKRDGGERVADVHAPLPTISTENRFGLVAPVLVPRYGEDPDPSRGGGHGQAPRAMSVEQPMPTITPTQNGASLCCAFMAKHFGDRGQRPGSALDEPLSTVTPCDHNALVASRLVQFNRHDDGRSLPPISSHSEKVAEVRAFLTAYFGNEQRGGSLHDPMRTVTPTDRFALVTVRGVEYAIVDIGMRMLTARELATAQGFPPDYILDARLLRRTKKGRMVARHVSPTAQKEMVGNSVNPQVACALALANLGAPAVQERAA